ncbi:unnamed protein product, partial [marine sediment metagenome]
MATVAVDAPPQQLTQDAKIRKIREKCRGSLFWTAWYLCGFTKMSIVLHYALVLWFEKGLADGNRWFLCIIPRGHFKTSLLNIAYIVHTLINDPNKRILMVMHNLSEATRKGRKLRSILTSRAMRIYFPLVIPPAEAQRRVWTSTEFSVNRSIESAEASVTLAGVASGL